MAARVVEHPVLIPTTQGPAGGIVCEPAGRSRASLLFLHTGGKSGRSGFGSEWALLSRRLAALGVTVLRLDLSTDGDSVMIGEDRYPVHADLPTKAAVDRVLLRDAVAWFRERTGRPDLLLAGACYGTRLGLELARSDPAVRATLMISPFFRYNTDDDRGRWRERMLTVRRGEATGELDRGDPEPEERFDPDAVDAVRGALAHGTIWVLTGAADPDDPQVLARMLGDHRFEVEVVPDVALYPGNDPDIQELVADRVVHRLRDSVV